MTDGQSMFSVSSVLLATAGFVPLALALGGSAGSGGDADPVNRVRPRTALQVSACLFTADVPWGTARVAVARLEAGEVDLQVLVEWLDSFGETATVFALVAGMDTDDLRAVLSGRAHLDIGSLRMLAALKGEI